MGSFACPCATMAQHMAMASADRVFIRSFVLSFDVLSSTIYGPKAPDRVPYASERPENGLKVCPIGTFAILNRPEENLVIPTFRMFLFGYRTELMAKADTKPFCHLLRM